MTVVLHQSVSLEKLIVPQACAQIPHCSDALMCPCPQYICLEGSMNMRIKEAWQDRSPFHVYDLGIWTRSIISAHTLNSSMMDNDSHMDGWRDTASVNNGTVCKNQIRES
jgi:hypothetical protein